LDDAAFREVFAQTPVKRLGRDRFLRNVLIAMGNTNEPAMARHAEPHLADPSPLVRAMAVWALSQLLDTKGLALVAERFAAGETDPDVQSEWQAALASPGVSGKTVKDL